MKVLILAAGYGTRLYPYTRYFPKPLLKVNKRPLIDYLLDKVARCGDLSRIAVVTNARFLKHFEVWKKTSELKNKIRIINDMSTSPRNKLGAIADMSLGIAKEGLGEDYLVLGGDNFLEERLEDFIAFARKKKPYITIGVVDVGSRFRVKEYGVVILGAGKKIIDFEEKPLKPRSSLAAMCLYYFPRSKLGLIRKCISSTKFHFDNIGAYIGWLTKNDSVYGYAFKKMWFDVGRPETYRKLNRILKEKEIAYG
jgi:glucose-1-phosphate thymidylyltransferase